VFLSRKIMKGNYKTIKNNSEGVYKEKGSKFFAYAYPVTNEQETKDIFNNLKKEHHGARHHCFAYRIGVNGDICRTNDDREPPNTAGKPILTQIDTRLLTNTLVIVVRYFGGTLLGVSGLINAYRQAASDALDKATIVTEMIGHTYLVRFDYAEIKTIHRIISEEPVKQLKQNFDEKCTLSLHVPVDDEERIIKRIKKLKSVNIINT
jgi:uncharacterized YigZ family protein